MTTTTEHGRYRLIAETEPTLVRLAVHDGDTPHLRGTMYYEWDEEQLVCVFDEGGLAIKRLLGLTV